MRGIQVFEVPLPDYKFAAADPSSPLRKVPGYGFRIPADFLRLEPDFHAVGKPVDEILKRALLGENVCIRAVASAQHPDQTKNELILAR